MALKTFEKQVELGTTSSGKGYLKLIVTEDSIDTSNNRSNCTATIQLIISSGTWRASSGSWSVSGNTTNSGNIASMTYYSGTTTLSTWTFQVGHDSSGNGSLSLNASFTSTYALNGSLTLTGTLTQIPRYAKITSFNVSKRDETSVTFTYTTDTTCDYAWYSKDNGSTWSTLSSNGIVSGLSANTTYNFKLRVRKQDSQLTTDSDRKQQTTYDYPKPTSVSNFTIGNAATIYLSNPLSRNVTLELISNNNGSVIGSYTGTGNGNMTGFNGTSAVNEQYASIPNATSGTYYAKVTYGSIVKTKGNGTYSIKGTETPVVTTTGQDTDKTLVNSINPTATTTDLTNDNTKIIKFISDVSVSASAVAQNYASIYFIGTRQGSGGTTSGSPNTYRNVENVDFTGSAVDTRNLYGESPITGLTLIDYVKLTIDDLEIYRDEQTSDTLKCRGNGNYFSGSFGANGVNNSITFQVRAKEPSQSWDNINWITKTVTIGSDNNYTFDFSIGTTYDYTKTYNVQVKATDKCMTSGILETVAKPGIPIQGLFENFHEAFGTKTFEKIDDNVKLNPYVIDGLLWYLVDSVTARTYIDIPDEAKEIRMITYVDDTQYTVDLLVERLSTTYKYVKLGGDTNYVHYEYNGTGIRCVQAYSGGSSLINNATTYMYYK